VSFPYVLISLLWAMPSAGGSFLSDEAVLQQAETAFRDGMNRSGSSDRAKLFRQASELYEELRRRGVDNPDLHRNQGNAALLSGNLAEAILAYRRGLRLAPNDRELRANLGYARDQVVYSSADNFARPATNPFLTWLPFFPPGLLLALTFIFYSVTCAGITRWFMTRQTWLLQLAGCALAFGLLFGIGLVFQTGAIDKESKYALVVISRDGTYLRKGNHENYPRSYDSPLNQGVEASLLYVRGDWLQVELAGGEIGWLPQEAVLVDTP
jgi:tetratricopeptide (TPR) repeat protein